MHQFPQICHDDVEYLLLPQLFLKLAISFGAIPLLVVSCLPTFLFLEMALLIKAPRKNNKHIYIYIECFMASFPLPRVLGVSDIVLVITTGVLLGPECC